MGAIHSNCSRPLQSFGPMQGCAATRSSAYGSAVPARNLCYLDVPAGKTSAAYTKPVNVVVRACIEDWARIRPEQHRLLDRRTGELVSFLFQVRNRTVDK